MNDRQMKIIGWSIIGLDLVGLACLVGLKTFLAVLLFATIVLGTLFAISILVSAYSD